MKRLSRRVRVWALVAAAALALCGCQSGDSGEARVLVDGAVWDGKPISPDSGDLRVYITLDGAPLIDVPFGEAHGITVSQPGVGENTIAVTGESVYMECADCENQDCVDMGAVTRDNLELRVMGGFIVCLPHRLSVEVR